jgi:hypothetical protein
MEFKLTTRMMLAIEKETKKSIGDLIQPIAEGKGLPIATAVSVVKIAKSITEDEALDWMESTEGSVALVVKALNDFTSKAWKVAEAGN